MVSFPMSQQNETKPRPDANASNGEVGPTVPISSAPFEIAPESFGRLSSGPVSIAGPELYRGSTHGRPQANFPLRKLVGIGCAVLVVTIGLALLLFR